MTGEWESRLDRRLWPGEVRAEVEEAEARMVAAVRQARRQRQEEAADDYVPRRRARTRPSTRG